MPPTPPHHRHRSSTTLLLTPGPSPACGCGRTPGRCRRRPCVRRAGTWTATACPTWCTARASPRAGRRAAAWPPAGGRQANQLSYSSTQGLAVRHCHVVRPGCSRATHPRPTCLISLKLTPRLGGGCRCTCPSGVCVTDNDYPPVGLHEVRTPREAGSGLATGRRAYFINGLSAPTDATNSLR